MTDSGYETVFAEMFGFVQTHPTFGAALQASEDPRAFRRGGVDFWNFKARVGSAFADVGDLVEFQHDPLFHFCTARDFGQDREALAAAHSLAPQWLERLLAVGDSPIGYRPGTIPAGACSVFHTRHAAQLAFLLHHVAPHRDPATLRIGEIGGGFGNFARLWGSAIGIHAWTILDLPFMTRLQQWYLHKTLPHVPQVAGSAAAGLRWVDTEHRNEFVDEGPEFDVLISTHAWSELPRDEWLWYLHALLPRTRHLLYAASNATPDPVESNWRLDRLAREMRVVDVYHTHGRSSVTALLTAK